MRRSALGLCTSLLLIVSGFAQMPMRNIPVPPAAAPSAFNCGTATGYTDSFTITFGAQSGLSADVSSVDAPFLGNSLLAAVASGGKSQSSGVDVVFCDKNDGTGALIPFEFVAANYVAASGAGEWWIRTDISKTTTKVIYGLVGKASAVDYSNPFTISAGSVSGGSFVLGETITQTGTGVTAKFLQASPFYLNNLSAPTTSSNTWTAVSGATFTPIGAHPTSVLWASYLAGFVYHLGTASTLGLADSAMNYPLTNCATTHAATAVAGRVGGGAAFSAASTQCLNTNTFTFPNASVGQPAAYTLEVQMANGAAYAGSYAGFGSNEDSGASGGWVGYVFSNGFGNCSAGTGKVCACIGYKTSGGAYTYRVSSVDVGSNNTWHHLAGIHTAGTSNASIYVDGALADGTRNSGGSPVDPSVTANKWYWGQQGVYVTDPSYTGYLDEMRIANSVLSADVIKWHSISQSNPAGTYSFSTP